MVKVVDALMGAGKTSFAVQYMKENPQKRFLYITPYNSEVDMVQARCGEGFFKPIRDDKIKSENLIRLLRQKKNIISTHELFSRITNETMKLLTGYTLIVDEAFDPFDMPKVREDDVRLLLEAGALAISDGGLLTWNEEKWGQYNGKWAKELKSAAQSQSLFLVNGSMLLSLFPPQAFTSFDEVFVMTYMFKYHRMRCYMDIFKIPYEYWHVGKDGERYSLRSGCLKVDTSSLPISIYNGPLYDAWKDATFSKTWYMNRSKEELTRLKNTLVNYVRNIRKAKSEEVLWTTFSDYKVKLAGRGYKKGFLACNAKATNDFKDRSVVLYTISRFENPAMEHFLDAKNVQYDEDGMALAEMLQFIWRSAIREGRNVDVFILSERMRNLLRAWLSQSSTANVINIYLEPSNYAA
jgi:hypothetical protein